MATNKPRLTLTLEPDVAAQVERLARLQGCPKSRVLAELLEGVGPVLAKVADTLELAMKVQKGARAGLAKALDEAEAELRPMLSAVVSAYDGLGRQIGEIADRLDAEGGGGADGRVQADGGPAAAQEVRQPRTDPRPVNTGVTDSRDRRTNPARSRPTRRP
jgi:hypothetical protein